jgi:hypothetical protein
MQDIGFFLATYRDELLLDRLLSEIRTHYPHAPIAVLEDGSQRAMAISGKHGASYDWQPRAKLAIQGRLWIVNLLQIGMTLNVEHCIKIEPDTRIHRPFAYLPDAQIAGTLTNGMIEGGCVYFKRNAIAQILRSQKLWDEKYRTGYAYKRYSQFRHNHELYNDSEEILLADSIINEVVRELKMDVQNWDEVRIRFRESVPDHHNFAATHPHPYPSH